MTTPCSPCKLLALITEMTTQNDCRQVVEAVLKCVEPLGAEQAGLVNAFGRVLAEDIALPAAPESTAEVLKSGEVLTPAHVAALAAARMDCVQVYRRPRVAICALRTEDEDGAPARFYSAGEVVALGCDLAGVWRIAASVPELADAVAGEAKQADVLLVCGDCGDAVSSVIGPPAAAFRPAAAGFALGEVEGKPAIVLPAMPVPAFLSFSLFARPALLHICGRRTARLPLRAVCLMSEVERDPKLPGFALSTVRCSPRGYLAEPVKTRSPDCLGCLYQANAILHLPPDEAALRPGGFCVATLTNQELL